MEVVHPFTTHVIAPPAKRWVDSQGKVGPEVRGVWSRGVGNVDRGKQEVR